MHQSERRLRAEHLESKRMMYLIGRADATVKLENKKKIKKWIQYVVLAPVTISDGGVASEPNYWLQSSVKSLSG